MAKISGRAFLISIEIAKKHSQDAYTQMVSGLCSKHSVNEISPVKWYELQLEEQDNPLINLAQQIFPGDALAVRKLARLQVRENTKRYHAFFGRIFSPKLVFLRASQNMVAMYDMGQFESELVNSKSMILHIRQFPEMPPYIREMIHGQIEGLGILMNRQVTITPDSSDPNDYRWKIEWTH